MPNWCFNYLTLSLPEPKRWEPISMRQIRWEIFRNLKYKFIESRENDFFQLIKPLDDEQENKNDWKIHNWGTLHEPNFYKFEMNGNKIHCIFETSWTHPYGIYIYLERLNFDIDYCYSSYENCNYGWGGNLWDSEHDYELYDVEYEELYDILKDESEVFYFDRIIKTMAPEIEDHFDIDMINFIVNCLAYYIDIVVDGYYDWLKENNLIDNEELRIKNLELKNKLMEWVEDDVEKNLKDEDSYIRICNTLKDSNYENTKNKIRVYLKNKFNMINYYSNKKYEPNLYFIYC